MALRKHPRNNSKVRRARKEAMELQRKIARAEAMGVIRRKRTTPPQNMLRITKGGATIVKGGSAPFAVTPKEMKEGTPTQVSVPVEFAPAPNALGGVKNA